MSTHDNRLVPSIQAFHLPAPDTVQSLPSSIVMDSAAMGTSRHAGYPCASMVAVTLMQTIVARSTRARVRSLGAVMVFR